MRRLDCACGFDVGRDWYRWRALAADQVAPTLKYENYIAAAGSADLERCRNNVSNVDR